MPRVRCICPRQRTRCPRASDPLARGHHLWRKPLAGLPICDTRPWRCRADAEAGKVANWMEFLQSRTIELEDDVPFYEWAGAPSREGDDLDPWQLEPS